MLRDWDTFMSLLLREETETDTDTLISSALQDSHLSTVLRLLVCSAQDLHQWRQEYVEREESQNQTLRSSTARHVEDFDEEEEAGVDGVVGGKRKRAQGGDAAAATQRNLRDWQRLVACVVHAVPKLLSRLSDEPAHVTLLLQLVDYCAEDILPSPVSSSAAAGSTRRGSGSPAASSLLQNFTDQTLRSLFKAILGQLDGAHSSDRIDQLAALLRLWVRPPLSSSAKDTTTSSASGSRQGKKSPGGMTKLQGLLESGVAELLEGCVQTILDSTQTVEGILLASDGDSTHKQGQQKGKGRRGETSSDREVMTNALFEMSACLHKFSGLWQCLDCRRFLVEVRWSACYSQITYTLLLYTTLYIISLVFSVSLTCQRCAFALSSPWIMWPNCWKKCAQCCCR